MLSAFSIFMLGALFCVVPLLVLSSLLRSGIPGIREWSAASVIGIAAYVLYAYGRALPPFLAYEAANTVYAVAGAAVLAGFRRFVGRNVPWILLGVGLASHTIAIALFHYRFDSYVLRTVTVAVFQGAVCLAIALAVLQSRRSWRSRYPYVFTAAIALVVALGHLIRCLVYMKNSGEISSLLQPSPWNLVFVSAGTTVIPVLILGGVMMAHDRMMAKAEHAANRDFLTGAWSRRAFFEFAEREVQRAQRAGRKLSLLVFDVDHFKSINDTYGHAAGDRVLADIGGRAAAVVRNIDYFARIGGEEFAVLLPEADRAAGLIVAERLRAALHRAEAHGNEKAGTIPPMAYSVSIGVATLEASESLAELMHRADAALYEAKAAGRNTVIWAPQIKEACA
ncbi:GGDEF domain-containing protein [Noviherbaspirillum massiliense]|uniref:GGDEF domain-containing protein n=1 Tax=Noviherbaspirillum massiliense TaxID=1465823 RepID=UPI00036351FF|nr:GGDEF domain-containing protein [Noviherbaspirillum massiliense]